MDSNDLALSFTSCEAAATSLGSTQFSQSLKIKVLAKGFVMITRGNINQGVFCKF